MTLNVEPAPRVARAERQVLFWLAALIILVLSVLVLKSVLLPFVAGMVIAYALNPLADLLAARGLPRLWASALVVLLLVVLLVLALVLLVPLLAHQVQQFAETLPAEIARAKQSVDLWTRELLGDRYAQFQAGLDRAASDLSSNWATVVGLLARSAWDQGLALVNLVSLFLVTPLVVFYLLVDWHPMLAKIDSWLPRDHAPTARRLARDTNAAIAAFIRGQGLVCLILAAFYAVGLSWAGLRYGLLVGLATGFLSFVPFVGWVLGFTTAILLALVQFWPDTLPLLGVIGVFAAAQALDAAVLQPKIVGPKIGLHPVWLIFALFVFSYLFGFVGVLVAVPLAAAVAVLSRFALEIYLASSVYRGRDVTDGPAARPDREPR
jgi:predicted PurR-regulated permease PerM